MKNGFSHGGHDGTIPAFAFDIGEAGDAFFDAEEAGGESFEGGEAEGETGGLAHLADEAPRLLSARFFNRPDRSNWSRDCGVLLRRCRGRGRGRSCDKFGSDCPLSLLGLGGFEGDNGG